MDKTEVSVPDEELNTMWFTRTIKFYKRSGKFSAELPKHIAELLERKAVGSEDYNEIPRLWEKAMREYKDIKKQSREKLIAVIFEANIFRWEHEDDGKKNNGKLFIASVSLASMRRMV